MLNRQRFVVVHAMDYNISGALYYDPWWCIRSESVNSFMQPNQICMSLNTFCNICLIKENIIKLCGEENERIINILVSFTSCPDIVNGIIYLCINCCDKLEEYDKFRELLLTNFVRFRYVYNEHKQQLEILNEPDIETKLKAFVDINVERPSGTPLIENCEGTQPLRNNTASKMQITCKESDGELFKIDLENLIHNDDLKHVSNFSNLQNETQGYHVKYENDYLKDDQENIHGSTIVKRSTHQANKKKKIDLVCNVCDKKFLFKNVLEKHIRTHTGERPFHCDVCQKNFTDKSYLTQHKRIHSGEKPYKCDECGTRFRQPWLLKLHKRTHTGERPYTCDECHKSFSDPSTLRKHKLVHTGERPYKCDECGSGFRQRSHLNKHQRTHTGEKPYSCDACHKSFTEASTLKKHKRLYCIYLKNHTT